MTPPGRVVVALIGAAALAFSLIFARQLILNRDLPREEWIDRPVRVLTTPAFVAAQGPGEVLFKKFELGNRAKLQVTVAGEALLERLRASPDFDAVVGIDSLVLDRARREFRWQPHAYDRSAWFEAPAAASDDQIVAYDWSPLAFVGRRDEAPKPTSFAELGESRFAKQFVIPDPRRSAPGLEFARWVDALAGDDARAWLAGFRSNLLQVAPSWTAAYATFERKRTRFVWTYLTSLAFHWGTQGDRDIVPLVFAEGHPVAIDFAAVPAACRACALGRALVSSLLEPHAQEIVMKRNFMMPVVRGPERGTVFAELPQPKLIKPRAEANLADWDATFPR